MKKHFYRIGHDKEGLWYDKSGEFTGKVHTEEYSFLNVRELRMPPDEEIMGFISVADSLEHLYQWFSREEIKKLQSKGFFIEEWISEDYKFYIPFQHNVINQLTSTLTAKFLIQ